jgi:hypothetical protein
MGASMLKLLDLIDIGDGANRPGSKTPQLKNFWGS